jgi:hypothetical protein
MKLTLLSPTDAELHRLAVKWRQQRIELERKGLLRAARPDPVSDPAVLDLQRLADRKLQRDRSAPNGSSIAFLAEYGGKTCMFLADAHMKVVCASIRKLLAPGQDCLSVDAVKLAHHGSQNNFTPEFLQLVDAEHFLFSSNGDKFSHPDAATVEAVIAGARRKPTLWFNYRSDFTKGWEADSLAPDARYATRYPDPGTEGIKLSL